jgi:proteic killer suppression protein
MLFKVSTESIFIDTFLILLHPRLNLRFPPGSRLPEDFENPKLLLCKYLVYNPDIMIKTILDKDCERFFLTGKAPKWLPSEIRKRVVMRFRQLDLVQTVDELRMPPSNRLERLEGDRKDFWSIRINDQWRVCFRYEDGNVFDVAIVDYH